MNNTKIYTVHTKISWSKSQSDLGETFDKWGVKEWTTNYPRGARLQGMNQSVEDRKVLISYTKNGKQVNLSMDKQARAVDNLRVLYLVIEALRMNEVRQVADVFESAYLQLNAPVLEKDPYDILGLPRGTARAVCEAQYKELARRHHTDMPGGSADKMKEINAAIQKIRSL